MNATRYWLIGSDLAQAIGIPRTSLYDAANNGKLQTTRTGCGRLVTTAAAVEKWTGKTFPESSTK